jgi:hypothetical protein
MPPTPKVKPKHWGKADKKYLSNLIRKGDNNITNTSYKNIKDIRREYFSHCNIKNFHRNFYNFAASLGLETEYNGARQFKTSKLGYLYFILILIVSHIFPSLVLSENGEEKVNHDNEDNIENNTKDSTNYNNGDNNDNEDNNTLMPPKEKPAAAWKTAAKNQNKDDKITHLLATKPPAISTFSTKVANPLAVSYYADGAHNYAGVVIRVNRTMEYGENEVQVAKDGRSILFVGPICANKKILNKKMKDDYRKSCALVVAWDDTVQEMEAKKVQSKNRLFWGKPQVVWLKWKCTGMPTAVNKHD